MKLIGDAMVINYITMIAAQFSSIARFTFLIGVPHGLNVYPPNMEAYRQLGFR